MKLKTNELTENQKIVLKESLHILEVCGDDAYLDIEDSPDLRKAFIELSALCGHSVRRTCLDKEQGGTNQRTRFTKTEEEQLQEDDPTYWHRGEGNPSE